MSLLNSGIVLEVDWDNDGDFDEPEENITESLFTLEAKTGRDWPSQLTGKAGPGLLRASLDNTDNRFSHYNATSPLNTAPFSLKTGRKCRVRVAGADTDPPLLAKDRFGRAPGALIATENGEAWTNRSTAQWVVSDQRAKLEVTRDSTGAVTFSAAVATVDVGVADHYTQITCANRDGTNETGIVYRYDDVDNYGLVSWRGQSDTTEVVHWEKVAGVFTATFDTGVVEFQADTTFGVLVDGTDATIYLNGVPMASGAAQTSTSTVVGIYGDWDEGRDVAVDDFYVWAGLTHELAGVLWTGDVSDLNVAVGVGATKVATLNAEGWLAKLAATDIAPPESVGVTSSEADVAYGVFSVGQHTGELVGKTLAKAQLLHPPGPIQRGDVLAGSVGLPNGKALAVARQFEEAEFGFLYETPEGPIGFDARTARDSSYSLATFSDAPTAGQLGYETIDPFDWRREIVNEVGAGLSPVPAGTRDLFGAGVTQAAGVATDVNVPLPDATQAAVGDLMIVVITPSVGPSTGQRWITPRGWVAFNTSEERGRVRIYAKVATQSDLGSFATFYDDVSPFGGAYAFTMVIVSLWCGDIAQGVAVAQPVSGDGADATTGQVDMPVLFPPWGRETTLFIALRSGMVTLTGNTVSGTGPPNGYRNFDSAVVEGTGSNAFDVAAERAFSVGNSDVEAPSRFTGTFLGFANVETNLIAVRGFNGSPPPPGGVQTVVSSDLVSQDEHNAVRSHRNPANLFRSAADARTYADLVLARYSDDRPIFALGYTATQSAEHLAQAVARRVSDRITLIADGDTGLNVNDDFHIESIHHRWTNAGKLWKVTYELSPAVDVNRADTADSELVGNIDAAADVFVIDTIAGPRWIDSATYPNMFPFAIQIGAEIIRVLSDAVDQNTLATQIFNVERGIDGTTAASHTDGAAVALAYPWELP